MPKESAKENKAYPSTDYNIRDGLKISLSNEQKRQIIFFLHHRSEIFDSWTPVTHLWGTFDLVVFKAMSNGPLSRKWLIVEQKGVKFETGGGSDIWGAIIDNVGFKIILESFGVLFSKCPLTQ